MSVPRTFVEKDQFVEKEKIHQLIEDLEIRFFEYQEHYRYYISRAMWDQSHSYRDRANEIHHHINQLKQLLEE